MRLLNNITYELEDLTRHQIPAYAILSHRWQTPQEEVSFHDHIAGAKRNSTGWRKIRDSCQMALTQDLKYTWIDTCCINKDSSAEESKSINSMFRWYQESSLAFVYLDDVHVSYLTSEDEIKQFSESRWFTRGWTLQELIAPKIVKFYNSSWQLLGDKIELAKIIADRTRIHVGVLTGEVSHLECSIATRMFWAAGRETTEPEDQAYCLMGLFDVNMPLLYGEGGKAFTRLQESILERSTDQTIFAWSDEYAEKGVLAPSPAAFDTPFSNGLREVSDYFPDDPAGDSYHLGNAGLSIEFVLIPWAMNTYLAPLRCFGSGSFTGADPTQRLCLILRQTKVDNRFVRISYAGKDLVFHRYLRVPKDANGNYFDRGRLHRRILIASSPLMKVRDCFYGFHFNFWCPTLFEQGSKPDGKDVVCLGEWSRNDSKLTIPLGYYRLAGIFRLTGQKVKGSMMFFGFDSDFHPYCYFASPPFDMIKQSLPLLNAKRDIMDPSDLSEMSGWERSSWLDGMYFHKMLDEIVKQARDEPGDWNNNCLEMGLILGERNTTEQVFVLPKTKLRLVLKHVPSFPESHWRITFKDEDVMVEAHYDFVKRRGLEFVQTTK